MLGPRTLLHYYRARLRTQLPQELLALAGIAVGVALIFAVQVANTSITGSVEKLVHGVTGDASIQVAARDTNGMDERMVDEIRRMRGVEVAAPVLERRVSLTSASGKETVTLIGATPDLGALHGTMTRGFGTHGLRLSNALVLPEPVAKSLGVEPDSRVKMVVGGRTKLVPVAATVPREQVGDVASTQVALAPLPWVQDLTGLEGRMSRVLVSTADTADDVRPTLERRFGTRLNVTAADNELALLRQAAAPIGQSTSLFAAISALVGVMFAFTAMLLTVPERRRFIAELRIQGFSAGQVALLIAFESAILGIAASAAGLALGDQLSQHLFEPLPGYLSYAFPVSDQRVVTVETVVTSAAAGIAATAIAGARPLADVFSRRPLDGAWRARGEPTEGISATATSRLCLGGVGLLVVTAVAVVAAPSTTVAAAAALAVSLLLVLPAFLSAVLRGCEWIARRRHFGLLTVSVSELRATPTRSVALASTAALALFGNVAIEGAHKDLLRGLDEAAYGLTHTAGLWVIGTGPENTLATLPMGPAASRFTNTRPDRLSKVRPYYSSFLDYDGRRVWVIARGTDDRIVIPPGQVVTGDSDQATKNIRRGGWMAMSSSLPDANRYETGDRVTLPTPSGNLTLRLAATLTNVGWAPGTLIINQRDYRRGWPRAEPSGVLAEVAPGSTIESARRELVARAGGAAVSVESSDERWSALRDGAREALSRLSQIGNLALMCAVLAVTAAMAAGVWQRRGRLAELKVLGFSAGQLWVALLAETALLVGFGGLIGAAFGLVGQALGARWLELTTGFPTSYIPAGAWASLTLGAVCAAALLVTAAPGIAAVRAPLRLSFREE